MTDPLGAQSGAGGDGQSAGTTDQGAGNAANAGAQSGAGTTGTTATTGEQSVVSRAEFDQLRNQLAAADRARVAAEQQFATLRDKDMPALQKAERDLQTANATLAERDATIASMQVELAFFKDNTHDWHSSAAALQLLDRSRVQVGPDGTVQGMKDALKALAQAHPYLLKTVANPADGQGGGAGTPPAPPAPGTAPTNGGITPPAGGKPTVAEIHRRFPATRQRL